MPENDKTYVSFKWMLTQTLALIISIIGVGLLISSSVSNKIDTGLSEKVSLVQFEERTKTLAQKDNDICDLINKYLQDQKNINDKLGLIEQNLAILIKRPLAKVKE